MGISLPQPTLADHVIAARDVVLATRTIGSADWEIAMVLKGDRAIRGERVALRDGGDAASAILTRRELASPWANQGPWSPTIVPFLKQVAALSPLSDPTDAQWIERLERFRHYLDEQDQRLARSAWTVWASAPYRLIETQAKQFTLDELRAKVGDPARASERSLWIVLLGIAGDEDVARWLDEQCTNAWRGNGETDLAALLTAMIAQRGAAGVEFVEAHYIRDHDRTLTEVQLSVAALGLHGREGTPAMRERIVQAYRLFVAERKPLAGFVARDLAEWRRWEFAPSFEEILQSPDPVYPSARMAMSNYLLAKSDAEAVERAVAPADRPTEP